MRKPLPLLLGATLLHTRYGHWQHPKTGRFYIRPVDDNFYGYPGIIEELAAICDRAIADTHTVSDEQRIQWLAQAQMGALDIYQKNVSLIPVSRDELLEDIADWFSYWSPWPQHYKENALLTALFSRIWE